MFCQVCVYVHAVGAIISDTNTDIYLQTLLFPADISQLFQLIV